MNNMLWTLIFCQTAMGGFDTFYHHELTERLAWRPSQAVELRLHGIRNLAYAVIFAVLGWSEPHGAAAVALIILMVSELIITLWDFVEEDRTRKLPASERITHTLLTLNYGVVLALLVPLLGRWACTANYDASGLSRYLELALRRRGARRSWIWLARSRRGPPCIANQSD